MPKKVPLLDESALIIKIQETLDPEELENLREQIIKRDRCNSVSGRTKKRSRQWEVLSLQ
jgi:hypothetical protein